MLFNKKPVVLILIKPDITPIGVVDMLGGNATTGHATESI